MNLILKNFPVFNEKSISFHNGINFIITDNTDFQKEMIEALSDKSVAVNTQIYVDEMIESMKNFF